MQEIHHNFQMTQNLLQSSLPNRKFPTQQQQAEAAAATMMAAPTAMKQQSLCNTSDDAATKYLPCTGTVAEGSDTRTKALSFQVDALCVC